MDDLQRAVAHRRSVREAEAARARTLVDEQVAGFDRWLASLDVVPTIAALRERGLAVVDAVLAENDSRWEGLSDADRERLRVMSTAIVNRLLHEPTVRLKGSAGEDSSYEYVQALRELFGLEIQGDGARRNDIPAGDSGSEVPELPEAPALDGERSADVTQIDSRRRRHG
ncbi:MAG: hypothetical protein H0U14_03270 [Thermoleophilaceae bacterium]|nr:hypothetical protein [Thermoleophilaceae bacterium]